MKKKDLVRETGHMKIIPYYCPRHECGQKNLAVLEALISNQERWHIPVENIRWSLLMLLLKRLRKMKKNTFCHSNSNQRSLYPCCTLDCGGFEQNDFFFSFPLKTLCYFLELFIVCSFNPGNAMEATVILWCINLVMLYQLAYFSFWWL